MGVFIRLYRAIPLIIVLAVLALIVYAVVSYRSSPNRAKRLMIKIFTGLFIGLTVFFALVALYALFEHNEFVAELFASFGLVTLVGLGITTICRYRFKKHHPHYADDVTAEAEVINPKPRWWPFGKRR